MHCIQVCTWWSCRPYHSWDYRYFSPSLPPLAHKDGLLWSMSPLPLHPSQYLLLTNLHLIRVPLSGQLQIYRKVIFWYSCGWVALGLLWYSGIFSRQTLSSVDLCHGFSDSLLCWPFGSTLWNPCSLRIHTDSSWNDAHFGKSNTSVSLWSDCSGILTTFPPNSTDSSSRGGLLLLSWKWDNFWHKWPSGPCPTL